MQSVGRTAGAWLVGGTAILATWVAACDSVTVSSVEVGEVEVTPTSAVVPEGGAVQFSAVVRDRTGKALPSRDVIWTSNAVDVATVDQDGMVRGMAFGTAAITASTGGASGSAVALVGQPPRIRIDPVSLTYSATEGETPAAKSLSISNIGELPLEGLSVEIVYGGAASGWITTALDRTTAPATLTVQPSAAGLASGTHTATVSVLGPLADNSPVHVPVTFTVRSSGPQIVAAPNPVQLSAATPQAVIAITNGGAGSLGGLAVSVTYQGRSGWLAASLSRTAAPATLTLSAAVAGLPDGTYGATVEVTSSATGAPAITIPVTLSMAPLPPRVAVSPGQLSLAAAEDASAPATADVSVTNSGGGSLGGISHSIRYGAGQSGGWLSASQSGTTAPVTLQLSASPSGLPQGNYAAVLEVRGNASNSPVLVQVAFTVLPPPPVPPNPPTGLAASVIGPTRVDLVWADAGGNETEFRIERRLAGGSFAQIATTTANTTAYSDTGVNDGRTYSYRVRACNDAGCSGYSGVASASTPAEPPAAPSDLRVGPDGPTRAHLFWFDQSDNETRFEVERSEDGGSNWARVATPGAGVEEHVDTGLVPVRTYQYRVRACNDAGCSAWSNVAAVTTPPAAPASLSAQATSSSAIALAWSDPNAGETDQRVERKQGTGLWSQVAAVAADVETFEDSSLAPATTYSYRVRACDGGECSPYSNVASATTSSTVPSVPQNLIASVLSGQDVDLTWTDASTTETSFRLERRRNGTQWSQLATVPANATTYRDSGLWIGTTYRYRLKACNSIGCSETTPDVRVTTQNPTTVPDRPSNLRVTNVEAGRVDLAWSDASDNEIFFLVQRRSGLFGDWNDLDQAGVNEVAYADVTVASSQLYSYRLFACNNIGCSPRTDVVSISTP